MSLESVNYVADLVQTNPAAGDIKGEGDDHIRNIKKALKQTFPNLSGILNRLVLKSANYTVVPADAYVHFSCSSGLTLALQPAATLGNGFMIGIHAAGADFTIDPSASELINGVTALIIPANSWGFLYCNGSAFSVVLNIADDAIFTSALQDDCVTLAKLAADVFSDAALMNGHQLGYRNAPQVAEGSGFTFELTDAGKHIYYTGGVANAVLPTNAAVAFPTGTLLTIAHNGSGNLTLTTAGVTVLWAGTVASGNRVIAPKGLVTLLKVGTDLWFVSGVGMS